MNKTPNRLTPTNSLEFHATEVHEVHMDLNTEALRHIAKDAQVLIIRVQVWTNGRPTTRTLRIPTDLLQEPNPLDSWDS